MHTSAGTLADAAAAVLRDNDRGDHTVAAPQLYPHQWSWDSAFVAVGWASLSIDRALLELRSLLAGQWQTGMLPQIVFSSAPGYFPGPDRWRTEVAPTAPVGVSTSGICQPPVHGLAVHLIGAAAHRRGGADAEAFDAFLAETFDAWLGWHRWLANVRGTHPTGLVEIHHGWESGMDNSPRWDGPYSRIEVGDLQPYRRQDLLHVADPAERPSDADYDRYVWLVDQLVAVRYDDVAARESIDFRVGDTFFTALHSLSARLLARLGERLGRTADAAELDAMADAARSAVQSSVDPATGLARDHDHRADEWLSTSTIGGFAPLICGTSQDGYDALVAELLGPRWCGHPSLHLPQPPTTSPDSPAFVAASYWRGPVWPVVSWLVTWCLDHHGRTEAAAALRSAGLAQLGDRTFGEYYHPLSGRSLGSSRQSWTAAAALAWTAAEQAAEDAAGAATAERNPVGDRG
ncbi:glucosylglycerate hydrolase [Nakamurella lactea]|uniref:glucosylglycerate hydrolase n=1 Tax=Nakamurella lactea TaxID=459515 RepID=UPI00048CC4BA|nr:glycogen debranching protein [Nakamurella lactea]